MNELKTTTEEFLSSLMTSESDLINSKFFELNAEDRHKGLKTVLKLYHCAITFTKVDGSLRTMPCTLRYDSLPTIALPQTSTEGVEQAKKQKPVNLNVLSVWCLDKQEWRSFKVMNVISVKRLDETVE